MGVFKNSNDSQAITLSITPQTFVRVILLIIGTVITLAAIDKAAHALLLISIAFFLAVALNAPVHWIGQHLPKKQRGNRSLATSLSFILVIALFALFVSFFVPPIVKQTQRFIAVAPSIVSDIKSENGTAGKLIRRYNLQDQVNDFSKQLSSRLKSLGGSAVSTVSEIGNRIFSLLTILVLTFMMLVEGPRWVEFMRRLVPKRRQDDFEQIRQDMYRVVKGYVNGQVTLAAIAAIALLPALLILHISYPIALVVVVFICGLIPMVGHTIGAIIVFLVALFTSLPTALIILGYYFLYQQIENYFIQPKIQANSTNLSPLLVFGSVVVGVSFNGLLGGLVAIPIAGCIRILILYYLAEQHKLTRAQVKETIS